MIRVGVAGWSYADWEGRVYPRRKGPGFHPLEYLSRFVDCVEVNSTFYALPRADYAERWVSCVEDLPRFRFTAKLHQSFTHEPMPRIDGQARDRALAFERGLEPLVRAGRLSAILVQFPLSFRAEDGRSMDRLRRIRELIDSAPLVVEVRHRSWFSSARLGELVDLGFGVATIDLPPSPDHPPVDALPPSAPHVPAYLRAHGRNEKAWFDPKSGRDQKYDFLYDADGVRHLTETAKRLAGGSDETFVVTNNHFSGKAVANAIEILAGLREEPPSAPAELVECYPRIGRVARVRGQQSLF